MKNEVLDILILGLLVVLFASIYRKRATSRLRCWVIAWVLVLAHFSALLLPASQTLIDSISTSTLLLSGLCFLLSASAVFEAAVGRALTTFGIGIPGLFYFNYVILGGARCWPLSLAAIAVAVAGTVLPWRLCCERTRVCAVITFAFVAGGGWSFFGVAYGQPAQGISALLFEVYLAFGALY